MSKKRTKLNRKKHRARLLGPTGVCKCYYCGDLVNENTISLDHLKPVSQGGRNNDENIVASCHPCNYGKGSRKHVSQYHREQAIENTPVVRLSREVTKLNTEVHRLKRIIVGVKVYSFLYKTIVSGVNK